MPASASLTCDSGKMRCSSGETSSVPAATIAAMSSPSPVVNQTEPCRPIRLVISQKALSGSVSITAPTVAARPPRRSV